MPDYGTARADFPGGDAATLYRSIRKILSLPDVTRLFMCHDYPPEGQKPAWQTTVGEEKKNNIMIRETVSEADYVKTRKARDHGKPVPRLLLPSLQVNLRAGVLGTHLKIPVNVF
jgi:glyoxylase-like metal-dependent hydrolase (beta-lactamase superfamily II)